MIPPTAASLLVLLALGGPPADDALQGDLARLQGTWTGTIGRRDNIPMTVEFRGRTVSATFTTPDGTKRTIRGEFRLDEEARPKAVDWFNNKTADGEPLPDNLGIYEIEGETTLKVCNGGPDKPRPTEFKEGENGPPSLLILHRQVDGGPPAGP